MKNKEFKIFLLIISTFVLLSNVNIAYSRYVNSATADTNTEVKRWEIAINNQAITYEDHNNKTIELEPVIDQSSYVRNGYLAPNSTGYFDLLIDASLVNISYQYTLSISKTNVSYSGESQCYQTNSDGTTVTCNMNNLKITGYRIMPIVNGTPSSTGTSLVSISNNTASITGTQIYGASTWKSKYNIRVYFKWENGANNTTDVSDTGIGLRAANGNAIDFHINASINFTQYTS